MSSILNHTITKIILSSLLAGLAVCVILMPEHLAFIQFCNHYANQIMLGYLLMGLLFLALRQKELMTLSFACCVALCLYLKLAVDIDREGFKKWRSGDQIQVESKPAAFTVAHFNLAAGTSEKHILEGIRLANGSLSMETPYTQPQQIDITAARTHDQVGTRDRAGKAAAGLRANPLHAQEKRDAECDRCDRQPDGQASVAEAFER